MPSVIRGSDDFTTNSIIPGLMNIVSTHYTSATQQALTAYVPTPLTAFNAKITPRSVNSKILVIAQWCGEVNTGAEENISFGLDRNGVLIGLQESENVGSRTRCIQPVSVSYHNDDNSTLESCQFHYIDTPETTIELTYRITVSISTTTTLFINQTKGTNDTHNYERGTSGITLIELIS